MYIKKQRLLTPGPTPLLPKALHAMMGSDIHHRTEDFRNVYRAVLADLKEVMGTSNDVLALVASGTGAMEASVSNLFSPGDRVIVCSAGKVRRALGRDRQSLRPGRRRARGTVRRIGQRATRGRGAASEPNVRGVFVQASETSTGAAHDVRAMGEAIQKTGRDLRGGRHHRSRHHAARYRRLGTGRGDRRLAKGLHDPARPGVSCRSAPRPGPSLRPPSCRATTSI